MKTFDIKTVTILSVCDKNFPIKVLVKGKYVGGKRWKRGFIYLNKDEFREIQLNKLL
jgi:hypothetical protein